MKSELTYKLSILFLLPFLITGCEWGGADDFNTSRGAGADVNFSGVYKGINNEYVVKDREAQVVVSQTGNTLDVVDYHNSHYKGYIGSPGVVASKTGTNYPSGATMMQSQANFQGTSVRSGLPVQFTGVFRAVAAQKVYASLGGGTNSGVTTGFFSINETNGWYMLEGNWTEGKGTYQFQGIAPALGASFSVELEAEYNIDISQTNAPGTGGGDTGGGDTGGGDTGGGDTGGGDTGDGSNPAPVT